MFLLKNVSLGALFSKIPVIIQAAISEKNRDRVEELIGDTAEMKEDFEAFFHEIAQDAGVCAQIVLEILKEPLEAAGVDLEIEEKSRSMDKAALEILIETEINKLGLLD
jgi:predicted transcriptional regulator